MIHKCSQCEYVSNFSYNTRRHIERKHGENNQKYTQICEKDTIKCEKDTIECAKDTIECAKDTIKNIDENQCKKCEKNLSNKRNYNNHIKICKGKINKLECMYCKEIFTCPPHKYRHQKTCKLVTKNDLTSSDLVIQNINNNITNNNDNRKITNNKQITNNDNRQIINNNDNRQITNNITLQIKNFGDENKDYITNAFLLQCYKNGYYGLVEMIENVYFNKEHPENHNVRIGSLKNKYLEIHKDDEWVPQGVNETLNRMINTTATDIILNVDEDQKEIEKIMEIQNLDTKKEKLLKESINGKLIARKKLKKKTIPQEQIEIILQESDEKDESELITEDDNIKNEIDFI